MSTGSSHDVHDNLFERLPRRLPGFPSDLSRGAGLVLIALWLGLFALAMIATIAGASGLTARNVVIWGTPSALFLIAAIASFWRTRRPPVAVLLSFAFLLLAATNFAGRPFWSGQPILRESLAAIGWLALTVGLITFPKGRFVPRWTWGIAAGAALFLLLDLWRLVSAHRLGPQPGEEMQALHATLGVLALCGFALLLMASCLVLAIRFVRAPFGVERQQLAWLVAASAITTLSLSAVLCVGIIESVLAPGQSRELFLGLVAYLIPFGFGVLGLGVAVALSGYGVRLANLFISGTAIASILALGLTALFAIANEILKNWLQMPGDNGRGAAIATSLSTGLSLLVLVPAQARLRAWVDARFPDALTAFRDDTVREIAALDGLVETDELLDEMLYRTIRGLHARHAAVLLGDRCAASRNIAAAEVSAWRTAHDPDGRTAGADMLFPLRQPLRLREGGGEAAILGWILVGPRLDDGRYSKAERAALKGVSAPLARAIRAAALKSAGRPAPSPSAAPATVRRARAGTGSRR